MEVVNGRTISLVIAAFLIGALSAAGIGVQVIQEARKEAGATSPPSPAFFVDPGETLIASTAVVATSVRSTPSSFAIAYDLVSLAPDPGVPQGFEAVDTPFVFPRRWVLTTGSNTIEGGTANPSARVARFDLPGDVTASDIASVQIIDPLVLYPLDTTFALSEGAPSVEVADGVVAELLSISEMDDSIRVVVEVSAPDAIDSMFTVEGFGPGWRSAVVRPGEQGVSFVWDGLDLPEVMTFRVFGTQWVPLEGTFEVSIKRLE